MHHIGTKKLEGNFSFNHLVATFANNNKSHKNLLISKLFHCFRVICGLTEDTERGHILRATLEAVCYQVRDILEAMNKDSQFILRQLKVDGGMTANSLLLQLQSDLAGLDVVRPAMAESSALVII